MKLKLLPLNYWLEYLDLVFLFKCLHGRIDLTRSFNYYFFFCYESDASSVLRAELED